MKVLSILVVSLCCFCSASAFGAENILLSAATTDKELILLNIEYANKKYKIVDHAIFKLPFQAGLTALGRLQNGNYQVVWTAQDASNKIKLNSMIFDADLNKVGNTKKFARVLSSHYNLNIVEGNSQTLKTANLDDDFLSYPSLPNGDVVLINRNTFAGTLNGPTKKLNTPPPGFRSIDTAIAEFLAPQAGTYYANLGYVDSRGAYALLLGDINKENYTSAYVFTGGPIISEDLIPLAEKDNYNFIHVERLSNPIRYRIANRQFDGPTCLPDGARRILWTTTQGDLGSLAFFNMLTAVPSSDDPNGGHVFFIQLNTAGTGTNLWGFHMNTETGKRNSPITNLDAGLDSYDYGLDGYILKDSEPQ